MSSASKNVAAKILKMVKSVGEIPRNGVNPRFNYKFVKETDVADKLRAACMNVGLVIIPSVHDVVRDTVKTASGGDQYRISLMLKLALVDPDTGESMEMDFPGEALDSQDKAVPKAITSAYKYALLKLAMNGGGEDDDIEHESTEKSERPKPQSKPTEVKSGTTYRKPETAGEPSAEESQPVTKRDSSPTTKSTTPVDKPMSTQTEPKPTQTEAENTGSTATAELQGTITAVIPAMRGKPATITFKPKDGSPVMTTSFDPKALPVSDLLKFSQSKALVQMYLDVTMDPPFVMQVQPV